MPKLLLLLTAILPFTINSQDIKVKKQDVFVNDSLYCHIDGKTSLINLAQGEMEFTISSLQGKELIFVKDAGPDYFKAIFLDDRSTMKIRKTEVATPGRNIKDFIKKMLGSHLLEADTINADAEKLFILKNDASDEIGTTVQSPQNNNQSGYTPMNDNAAYLVVSNNDVSQNGKTICTYTSSNQAIDGTVKTTVIFYLPNGAEVAKLIADNFNATNYSLLTLKDNRLSTEPPLSGDMTVNKNDNIKTTVLWLIEHGYL